jgi:hypothetical protein
MLKVLQRQHHYTQVVHKCVSPPPISHGGEWLYMLYFHISLCYLCDHLTYFIYLICVICPTLPDRFCLLLNMLPS